MAFPQQRPSSATSWLGPLWPHRGDDDRGGDRPGPGAHHSQGPRGARVAVLSSQRPASNRGQSMAIGGDSAKIAERSAVRGGYQMVDGIGVYDPSSSADCGDRRMGACQRFLGVGLVTVMVLLSALLGVAYLLKTQEDARTPLGRGHDALLAEPRAVLPHASARSALLVDPSSPAALDCRQPGPGCPPPAALGAAAPGPPRPARTILAVACGAGSAQIEVASEEGFNIGDLVQITSQVSSESKTITAMGPVALDGPLISMYPVGSTVTRLQQAGAWPQGPLAGEAVEEAAQAPAAEAVEEAAQAPAAEAVEEAAQAEGANALAAIKIAQQDAALAEALNVDVEPAQIPTYDCLAGFFNWRRGWADDKKSWCCVNENRGCPGEPDESAKQQALVDPGVDAFKAAPAEETDTSSTITTTRTKTTTMTTTRTSSAAVTRTNTTTRTSTTGTTALMETTTNTTSTTTLTQTNSTTATSTSTRTGTATNTTTRTQTSKTTTSTSTRTPTTSTRTSTTTRTSTSSSTRTATTTTTTRTVSTTSTHTATTRATTGASTTTSSTARLQVASEGAPKGHDSLWCVTLITPWSEEKLLLQIAQAQGKSVYQCDGHAVYSNPVVDLGGSETRLLGVDLHCPTVTVHTDGISYEATDNAGVFAKLWERVISDGDFRDHDWVVKVHPDVVFLPDRLKAILSSSYAEEGPLDNGILLSNCKLGLHGPLEVMSTRALEVYAAGHQRCELGHQEDVYLQKCAKDLGVSVVNNFDVLADKFCYRGDWHQTPDWFKCTDKHAAFHPFKSAEAYLLCLQAAEAR